VDKWKEKGIGLKAGKKEHDMQEEGGR